VTDDQRLVARQEIDARAVAEHSPCEFVLDDIGKQGGRFCFHVCATRAFKLDIRSDHHHLCLPVCDTLIGERREQPLHGEVVGEIAEQAHLPQTS